MASIKLKRDLGISYSTSHTETTAENTIKTPALWFTGKAKRTSACVLTLVLTTTVGCASTKADSPEMALLATSSQAVATSGAKLDSVAVIESAIGQWFGGMDITLADNAFTASSSLSIERKGAMDKRGLPLNGRHSNPAFVFTLLKRGDECFIRNEQNTEEKLLDGVDCTAVNR